MVETQEIRVTVRGRTCRTLKKGSGPKLIFLPGYGGLPRWCEFLEQLSQHYEVIAVSLPGLHGSDRGHQDLHGHLDWLSALHDLLDEVSEPPYTIIASSVSAMLACELAGLSSDIEKLILIGPLGLYDENNPPTNLYAKLPQFRGKLLAENRERYTADYGAPSGCTAAEKFEFEQISYRAEEACARIMWPFGDIGLRSRIHRIQCPTLILWGEKDQVVPIEYAMQFGQLIGGPVTINHLKDAGHLAFVDAPAACAESIHQFLD